MDEALRQWAADVVASLDENGRPTGNGRRPAPTWPGPVSSHESSHMRSKAIEKAIDK